jgi:predicted enzyme related to lactoylglutathione lyase
MPEPELTVRTILLSVDELDGPLGFYRDAVGMTERFRDGDRYAALDAGGVTVALAVADEHPAPGATVLGCKTPDVAEAVRRLVASGADVLEPPVAGRHETRALLRAPGGALISVYGPLAPSAAPAPDPVVHARPSPDDYSIEEA